MLRNIYLDIDGVLLQKDGQPAVGLDEFLEFVTSKFDCYWLTTHCKGDNAGALHYLRDRVSKEAFYHIGFIKPTIWQTYKTEAINFNEKFLWLDDYIFEAERQELAERNLMDSLQVMDLKSNPNQLLAVLEKLRVAFENEFVK